VRFFQLVSKPGLVRWRPVICAAGLILASVAYAQTVPVDSAQLFNATGVFASGGQVFQITSTGSVNLATQGGYVTDPDGTITVVPPAGSGAYTFYTGSAGPVGTPPSVGAKKTIIGYTPPIEGAPFGVLVAGFSSTANPATSDDFPNGFVLVGSFGTITASTGGGYLFLTVNDINRNDNSGSFTATVSTILGTTASAPTLVDYTVVSITSNSQTPQRVFQPTLRGNPPFSNGGPEVGLAFHAQNVPANSAYRYTYFRPDGSLAFDSGTLAIGPASYGLLYWYRGWFLWLNAVGKWQITVDLNGVPFINANFIVAEGDYAITTIAGSGSLGDDGPATGAILTKPEGATSDSAGNLYITEGNRVRKVSASGVISTIAGTGVAGYNGDGIPATSAQLNDPITVAVDGFGTIYM
jgi:hypothetical protein